MKIVIQIFIICILAGCNSIRVANKKTYVFTSVNNDHSLHKLELSDNQTFVYKITGSLNEVSTSGNWRVEKNKLYLKSFDEYRSGYCKISNIESTNIIDGEFKVYIVDNVGTPLAEALIFYGKDRCTIRQDGIVTLRRGLDTTVNISFLGIEYHASLSGLNKRQDVKIEIVQLDSRKLYLNDEVWKVRKNMIISPLNKKLVRFYK